MREPVLTIGRGEKLILSFQNPHKEFSESAIKKLVGRTLTRGLKVVGFCQGDIVVETTKTFRIKEG